MKRRLCDEHNEEQEGKQNKYFEDEESTKRIKKVEKPVQNLQNKVDFMQEKPLLEVEKLVPIFSSF